MKTSILSRVVGLVVVTGFALMAVPSSQASTVLVSNLAGTETDTTVVNSSAWSAFGFKTDATAYTIESVTLKIVPSVGTLTNLVVKLYSSTTGGTIKPLTEVGTFGTLTTNVGGLATYNFSGGVSALDASTDYWVVVGATGSNSYNWSYTDDLGPGGLGAIFSGWSDSGNQGGTWTTTPDPSPYMVSVTVAVPEPSSFLLLGLGAAALAGLRLRRRS